MQTIAAISTPLGAGGLGIVRLSGPEAREVAGRVFASASGKSLEECPGYTSLFGRVSDGDGAFDQCVAAVFRAPKSYTGEEVVELSCHGGAYVIRRLLAACLAAGAGLAEPGEFTRRAFLNGKLDLAQAEAVMELIGAQGKSAAQVARAGQEGRLSDTVRALRETLTDVAAHLSAWADYPDDDIPQVDEEDLKKQLTGLEQVFETLLAGFQTGKLLREGVHTVIAGKPNVGKSTLMNLLSGSQKSIVTAYAGTTRDIVEDTVLLGELPLLLADTAGLRESEDPVERIGIEKAREKLSQAQLVLAVFDASQPLTEEDKALLEGLGELPAVAVVNKTDLQQKLDIKYISNYIKHIVYISALQGSGVDELSKAVEVILHTAQLDPAAGVLFTERQRDAVRRALDAAREAREALFAGWTLDAVTVSVEAALSALLELTGERATEAVVDEVFQKFCVGK